MEEVSWLDVVQPHLSRELVLETTLGPLTALARRCAAADLVVLEARLGPGSHQPVDLSFRLDPASARTLAGLVEPESLRSLLRSWGEVEPTLERVPALWLEFDLDDPLSDVLSPSVCAKLGGPFEADWLEEVLLPRLQGEPLSPAQRDRVRVCCEAIPPPADLLYAFCMLPRPGRPIRLEIYGLDSGATLGYLERVAPGVVPQVREPATLFEGVERPHLSLDLIGGEISPRIGIEGSFARQPQWEPRWRELFDRLAAAGLCSEAKAEAALGWPGWDSFWTALERWPVQRVGAKGYCVRYLSHVKVVCRPDCLPEAKVYLALGWIESGEAGARLDGRGGEVGAPLGGQGF